MKKCFFLIVVLMCFINYVQAQEDIEMTEEEESAALESIKNIEKDIAAREKTFNDLRSDIEAEKTFIYIKDEKYNAIDYITFKQNKNTHDSNRAKFNEGVILTIGKMDSNKGLIYLEKLNVDITSQILKFYLTGKLLIYLEDGTIIKCIDRRKYGYHENTSSILYHLTKREVEMLMNSRIEKISYNLTEWKSRNTFNFIGEETIFMSNPNYIEQLKLLFTNN